jgi:hypothetical protein
MKFVVFSVFLQIISVTTHPIKWKISCSCDPQILCYSSEISRDEIHNNTVFVIDSCGDFNRLKVRELQISWARQGIVRSFHDFPNLESIKISNSLLPMAKLSIFKDLKLLRKLVLYDNDLKTFEDFPELGNLEKIFISKNNIQIIRKTFFHNLPNLKLLRLEENGIFHVNSVAFKSNVNLEEINLNRNDLRFLEPQLFHHNLKLKEISMTHNKLKSLPPGIFATVKDLEVLRLHGNHLRSLDGKLFETNQLLRWIELGDNQLTFLSSKLFSTLNDLEFVDLFDNECIEGSFPTEMNFEHLLRLVDRNCHYLAAYNFEFI